MQRQHQAGFQAAGMEPLAALRLRDLLQHPRRPAPQKPRQHRKGGELLLQLPGSHLQQRNLTAMAVEQHQAAKSSLTQGSSNTLQLGQQGFRAEAHRAGKPQMLRGKTKRQRWQTPQR